MNYKKLFLIILVTFLIATVPSMFISSNIDYLNKPFAIPNIIFPIVWTILYLLMSIAYYLVSDHQKTLPIYLSQLIFNSLWTIIFFGLKLRLLAFIWLILLLLQVIYMTSMYFKIFCLVELESNNNSSYVYPVYNHIFLSGSSFLNSLMN